MAADVQESCGVPWTQSWMWSIAALAAEAAEESPRASMIAAPRLATVGMKVSASQAWSSRSRAGLPSMVAWVMSGYGVAEGLSHTGTFLMLSTGESVFVASGLSAR